MSRARSGFQDLGGRKLPRQAQAVWQLPNGPFMYADFSFDPTQVSFNVPPQLSLFQSPRRPTMMSLPQSMPSLFGRFTAILKDHHHLATRLRQLKALCSAIEDGRRDLPPELEPQRLLTALRTELGQHFGAEESDEYFGTVISEDPLLEAEIAALKSQHARMLRTVDVLAQLALAPARWPYLPGPMRLLVMQLERHEGSESKLLRSFFFRKG